MNKVGDILIFLVISIFHEIYTKDKFIIFILRYYPDSHYVNSAKIFSGFSHFRIHIYIKQEKLYHLYKNFLKYIFSYYVNLENVKYESVDNLILQNYSPIK